MKIPGFRHVEKTGVIYVMSRANALGFDYESDQWANLGQGSPETGPLDLAPERIHNLQIDPSAQKYSPVPGCNDLRQKVADFYNAIYRRDKASQYTKENVSIAGGGRLALTRLAASLGNINMGHFLPDYTAYEELLSIFKAFTPIPILLELENNYQIPLKNLSKEIYGRGLRALLISNPCNPTGQLIQGQELKNWVDLAREAECSFIFDEFYSHYIYDDASLEPKMISAAEFIEDVNRDPIVIVDGLTKNWRYPGWRISWTLGPKSVIEAISSAGSFLDGGANHPIQNQAQVLLDVDLTRQETLAISKTFRAKRDFTLRRLQEMGIKVPVVPNGAFYVWADLSDLPEPINDGMSFFEQGLLEKVITVPGIFFDVNPSGRRINRRRYNHYCRVSFGPEMPILERGLNALERVINKHRAGNCEVKHSDQSKVEQLS